MEIIPLFLSFCICLLCPGSIFNQVMMVALGFSNYHFLLPYSILSHSVTEYAFSNSLLVLCLYHDYSTYALPLMLNGYRFSLSGCLLS